MSPTGDRPLPGHPGTDACANTGATLDGDPSDEQLVQHYAAGELAAFDTLYARYELPVWRYALRILRVPSMADTLLKDIWFSVLRQIADPTGGVAQTQADWRFKPWLFGLAHSRVLDAMRSARKPIDTQGDDAMPEPTASERNAGRLSIKAPDPASRAGREVAGFRQLRSLGEAKTLLAGVEHLPFAQRYAFLMHAEGRLRADDIARATAVSFETAINRLRFAREALRLSLAHSP